MTRGNGNRPIPYGRQTIDEADLRAVARALRSDWLTQGPMVAEFEAALAKACGAPYAVAFTNGTAALQAAYAAAGLKKGDEFVTSPLTFASTATAGLWQGARPVFADIDPATGNLDPKACERAITPKTRLLVPVDYAGLPADLESFRSIAKRRGLLLISDACHSLGATIRGKRVGTLADMSVLSFHPVKTITTGEGGAVITADSSLRDRLIAFRQHGIRKGSDWEYFIDDMGLNYRLTDIQSALGLSQLKKLPRFLSRRRELARRYDRLLAAVPGIETAPRDPPANSAWHLYILRLRNPNLRRKVFQALRERGIGVQVHYIPVYWHPLYEKLGYKKGLCPKAEEFYSRIISLPLFPTLTDKEQDRVVATLRDVLHQAHENSVSR